MSWKSFACLAALAAMVTPAAAAPTIGWSDDMAGTLTLQVTTDAAGSLAAEILIDSTATLSAASIADSVFWDTANPGANSLTGGETTGLYLTELASGDLFVSYGSDVAAASTTYDLLSLTYDDSGDVTASGTVAQLGVNNSVGPVVASVGGTTPFPGDFDGNGSVGDGDLTLLLGNWGATVPPVPAGWDGFQPTAPGVGDDELTALLNNWGQSAGSAVAVPEPAAALLALIGVACLNARRSA